MNPLYYESHVTIEPVIERHRIVSLNTLAEFWGFKVASLYKDSKSKNKSTLDSFCSSRSQDLEDLKNRMEHFVAALKYSNFEVWRHKIEAVLSDVKIQH